MTIGINGDDATVLKDILMSKTTEQMVTLLTAGQVDGAKPIMPSQIQKNIINTENKNPEHNTILNEEERSKIVAFSGKDAYIAGTAATTDTPFEKLNDDEMANALKAGLIDIKTYLNMDNPNTTDTVEDFNGLGEKEKQHRLEVIQKSRDKKLEDLYPAGLVGGVWNEELKKDIIDQSKANERFKSLTLDQALMITGTDGRAVADANSTDHINMKADLKNASLLKSGGDFSADAFRMMAMQYTNKELEDGKLEAMVKIICKEVEVDYEGDVQDVVNEFLKDGLKGDDFNNFIGELFNHDADDGDKDGLYSKDAMINSLYKMRT